MRHAKIVRRLGNGLIAGALYFGMAAGIQAAEQKEPVKFGAVLSMSGPGAVFGLPMRNAISVALEQVNENGGINGRPVDVLFYDDRTEASEAARGVTQLVNREKVVAIMGPGTGGNVLAAGPIAERLKVPLLAPVGTIQVTDKANSFYSWTFRTTTSDALNIRSILEHAANSGAKRVGVFFQEDAYGKTGVEVAQGLLKELDIEIPVTVSSPYTATDLSAQAIKLREANVDAVFMQVSVAAMGANFLKAAREVGLNATLYGNSGLAQRSFVESAGPASEGFRIVSLGNIVYDPSESEKELADLLVADGKQPQGWGELVGSNAFLTAVAAARSIDGEITGESMRDAIETACGFEAYTRGKPCFDLDDHDGWKADAVVIGEVRDGKLVNLN